MAIDVVCPYCRGTASSRSTELATLTGEARTLGDYTAPTTTSDIDNGLIAELGSAVTRGAEEIRASQPRWQHPAALPGPRDHAELAVPQTAPHTAESNLSIVSPFREAVVEGCVTAVVATAGAVGGALAGEMLGGDLAATHIGTIAETLGQAIGRNLSRIAGRWSREYPLPITVRITQEIVFAGALCA